ncbi:MAG: HAMP domain-containing sensor histidine kinase [Chitinophagaceae bacterium]
MKRIFFIFFLISFLWHDIAICQRPDLTKMNDQQSRVDAWLAYCDSTKMHLASHGFENESTHQNLTTIALEGLELAAKNDTHSRAQFFSYAAQGFFYSNSMNGDSIQFYYNKSLEEAIKSRSAILITDATVALLHMSFEMQGNKNSEYLKNILQVVTDTTKDMKALSKSYAALGNFYQHKSYYSTAQDFYIKSIGILKREIDSVGNMQALNDYVNECYTLAQLYLKSGSPEQALGMLREGNVIQGISPLMKIRYKAQFIKLFSVTGQIDSALIYLDKYIRPLEIQFKSAKAPPYEIILSNLSIGEYYLNKNLFKDAFPFIEKGNDLGMKSGQPVFSYDGEILAGKYYFKTGDYKKAISSLSIALPDAQQFSKEAYAEAIKYMGMSLQAEGKNAAAIKYFSQYAVVLDSLTAEKISTNLADQATRYETGRKESRIKFLDNENRLSELELHQANRTRLLLIIGLGALGIISLLLYFIYRNREKANKILNDRNLLLDKVNDELSVANETKAKLFGVIGHDLRAPVSKIVQMLHFQKNNSGHAVNTDDAFTKRINKASENVLETMEDLLLWSKSQMKNFTPQYRIINGLELLREEIDLFVEDISDKKLMIDLKITIDRYYKSDENFLRIIIRNILQNAIRNSLAEKIISIELLENKIVITNECENPDAEKLNSLLGQKNISSHQSGFGLQMVSDLAKEVGLKIYFEESKDQISAVIDWIAKTNNQ